MASYKIPWSLTTKRSFNYNGLAIIMGTIKFSQITQRHYFSITIGDSQIDGIALVAGVDLLQRFSFNLPPMYAFNAVNPLADPNPDNLMLIFEEG